MLIVVGGDLILIAAVAVAVMVMVIGNGDRHPRYTRATANS